jgi:hypothetical protein
MAEEGDLNSPKLQAQRDSLPQLQKDPLQLQLDMDTLVVEVGAQTPLVDVSHWQAAFVWGAGGGGGVTLLVSTVWHLWWVTEAYTRQLQAPDRRGYIGGGGEGTDPPGGCECSC